MLEKILVLILLDMMFQQVETIYFVIASIVFFLLMRANLREPYRMGLKSLEHHALLVELKFRQHVGCNYFVNVLIVIQILYEIPRFLLLSPM